MNDIGSWFAETAFAGPMLIAIPIAMLAGVVSFLSPCMLPVIPGYFAYVSGMLDPTAADNRRRLVIGVLLFVAGFSLVFVAYGAAFGAIGSWLVRYQDPLLRVLGVVTILFGIVMLGAIPRLQRMLRIPVAPKVGLAGAPVLGIVFGLGWTPCIGPTLAAVLSMSLSAATAPRGALLAFAYCLGIGIPLLLCALLVGSLPKVLGVLRRHVRAINVVGAVGLIVLGVVMASGLWGVLMSQLQGWIGGFTTVV